MKWVKPSQEKINVFLKILPQGARVEPRKMFGYPCAFVNGNMFCGMHGNDVVVRLPENRRKALVASGWTPFEPMPGRFMNEYLVIPEKVLSRPKDAADVLLESLEFTAMLPKKVKTPK
ncbi:TfoX/Sxy family protein [Candidatus Micrarchaeota archaeon]|nr:TfoX/Sxy family protein [Candidatus Micrarchaeota archaeon]